MQKLPYFLSQAKSQWLSLSTSAKCAGLQPTLPARSSRYARSASNTLRRGYALEIRTLLWFGHGCSGNRMLSKHERYYGLGMDALVIVCSSFSRSCPRLFAARPPLQPSWLASPAPWPTPRGPSPPSASTNHRAPWQEKLL